MDRFDPSILLMFPVLLFSLSVHECAHAWTALRGGDTTAKQQGRITLNPISHIDVIGTIVLPLVLALAHASMFGWAKPVPVNEGQLRNARWMLWVSMAGPGSNLLIAAIAAIAMKVTLMVGGDAAMLALWSSFEGDLGTPGAVLFRVGMLFVMLNLVLAIFNMLPIPPLDGSKLLYHFVFRRNFQLQPLWISLNRFGFIFIYVLFLVEPVRRAFMVALRVPIGLIYTWLGVS